VTAPQDIPHPDRAPAGAAPRRWPTTALAVGGVLALLLLGAAVGMLVGVPGRTSVPPADSVDVGFSQDMTVHHEQAVEMAGWVRDHSADPAIRALAHDIESTQTSEIGRMQGWLALWGASALPTGAHMRWMTMPSTGAHGHVSTTGTGMTTMPGMASPADLRALKTSSGKQLDVLFLQLMLRHHQGGTPMLDYTTEHATVAVVRAMAGQWARAQAAESDYLRSLLTERGASPLPG